MSVMEILKLINSEDQSVALAVQSALPEIGRFAERVIQAFQNGGRLFYAGAGTSGRLGVLDASEIPPTFSADPSLVQGIIAGGPKALVRSVEGAEDHKSDGRDIIRSCKVTHQDAVLGIATSGTTPYVIGALEEARDIGAATGLLVCCEPENPVPADVLLKVITGPEIIAGSTRMKAGTATKMVLNMITTTAMIRLNKTYGNLMVDMKALNRKLWDRGTRLLCRICGLEYSIARKLLESAEGEVKTAVVMHTKSLSRDDARRMLSGVRGSLRELIG